MIWNLSCSGTLMVSTIARWMELPTARRNSGLEPLRRAMRTSGMSLPMPGPVDGCSGLRAQVERLPPGEREERVLRERHALAGVLHPGPGQQRIEVVAPVHEEGAGLDLRPDAEGAVLVARPDRRGEAVGAVVHQPDRLVVVRDPLHADDGPEALLHHQAVHGVVRIDHQAGVEEPAPAGGVV